MVISIVLCARCRVLEGPESFSLPQVHLDNVMAIL